ncbi:MAG: phosphatidate cytidylyltransferase [Bdellovibrionaceae bacterium]|nr:phosphatidate cytidylyltransferase [Pseudobdellovibrionaceae bacterium]
MRWISALSGLLIILVTTYFFGNLGLVILASLIILIAASEFALLFSNSRLSTALFVFCSTFLYFTHVFYPEYTLPTLMLLLMFLASKSLVYFSGRQPTQAYLNTEWTLWGIIYCGLFPALTLHLTYSIGWKVLYFLLITVFLGDSCAFFTGKIFGGKKIFPNISPKKTFSGAVGGLLGSVIFGVGFVYFVSPKNIDYPHWILVCLTMGFFAQLGDFFESLVKRFTGKKDSGRLMPGHGGFLDRVDGTYFGSVILYVYSYIYDLGPFFS